MGLRGATGVNNNYFILNPRALLLKLMGNSGIIRSEWATKEKCPGAHTKVPKSGSTDFPGLGCQEVDHRHSWQKISIRKALSWATAPIIQIQACEFAQKFLILLFTWIRAYDNRISRELFDIHN